MLNYTITAFEELLVKDKTFTLSKYSIIGNKICTKLSIIYQEETLVNFMPEKNHNFNLRSISELTISSVNTIFKGQNSITYFGSVIWNSIPAELRGINSFQVSKSKIKAWRPTNCPCRLSKNYTEKLGFVNICC